MSDFVQRTIDLARQNVAEGGRPFATVIVKDAEILAESANKVAQANDPTAHAEMLAIREACVKLGTEHLVDCAIYVLAQPCPMCLGSPYYCSPKEVIFLITATNRTKPRWASTGSGTNAMAASVNRRSSRRPEPTDVATVPTLRYYLRMHADSSEGRLPDDQAGLAVEVFRMLADATRVQVLWSLTRREMSVNELAEHVGKPAPSVSQHLAKLRMARLVRTRRNGTTIFYSLENDHVRQLVIDAVRNAEHTGTEVPPHHRGESALKAVGEKSPRG